MASNDETVRLILETTGQQGIDQLAKSTDNYRKLLADLAAATLRGEQTTEELEAQTRKFGGELERETRLLKALQAQQAEQAAAADPAAQAAAEAQRQQAEAAEAAARALEEEARADKEALEVAGRFEAQQRELAEATKACAEADRELNRVLRDDAAAQARTKLAALEAEGRDVANAFARGEIETRQFVASMDRLEGEASQLRNQLQSITAAANAEAAALDRTAGAAGRAGAAAKVTAEEMRYARQGALDVARSVQDFAQGGFAAILNNLEGLGRGIPALLKAPMLLLSNLPTVLTLVGVALWQFGPAVWNAFKGFAFGANEVPKATDALGKIDGRLKEVTQQLDKYREMQHLTNGELADYNRLSSEQVVLEKAKKQAMEDKQAAEKRATSNPIEEDQEKERAKLFEKSVGTPQLREQLIKSVQAALPQDERRAELMAAIKKAKAARDAAIEPDVQALYQHDADQAQAQLTEFNQDIRRQAEKLVDDAVIKGKKQATENIQRLQQTAPGKFNADQRRAVGGAVHANKADFDDAADEFKHLRAKWFDQQKDELAAQMKVQKKAHDEELAQAQHGLTAEMHDTKTRVGKIVSDFGGQAKGALQEDTAGYFEAGQSDKQVQKQLRQAVGRFLDNAHVQRGADHAAATSAIAEDILHDVQARISARQAEMAEPGQGPVPRRQAAASIAGEIHRAGVQKADAREKGEEREALAGQIQGASRGMTGRQFTREQSRDAATAAMKTMEQMGEFGQTQMGVNQAVMGAMAEINHNMGAVFARLQQQGREAREQGRRARKIRVEGETRLAN